MKLQGAGVHDISYKNILLAVILMFSIGQDFLFAGDDAAESERKFSLWFAGGFGVLSGVAGEYVYSGGNKISDLQWDTKPLYFLEFENGISLKDYGSLLLRYRYGIGGESGEMTDFDPDYPIPGTDTLSRHDAVTLYYHEAEIEIFVSFIEESSWRLSGGISYLLLALQIDGRDGYKMENDVQTGTFEGSVIRYTQIYQILPFMMSISFQPWEKLRLSGIFAYTPLVFCNSTDIHYLTDTQYNDSIVFGHYLYGSLIIDLGITEYLILSLGGDMRWVPPVKGDTTSIDFSTGTVLSKSRNTAGVSLYQMDFLVRVVYRLEW